MATTLQQIENMVESKELTKLHTSLIRRYVSRVSGPQVEEYKGKFGEGYIVLSPNWDSSRYSYVTYYVN